MVRIGLIGKPNVGKSTLFSALTKNMVEIANYPFTTLKPNVGVAFLKTKCPETEIGKKCNPREGVCIEGIRYVPIEIIDVPGLIPGASEGKGMGNAFLDNIRDSEAIIHVFDASGKTSPEGTLISESRDPVEDIATIESEITKWMADRIFRDWEKFARKSDASAERPERAIAKKVASFGISEKQIAILMNKDFFPGKLMNWGPEEAERLATLIFREIKPIVRVANKSDAASQSFISELSKFDKRIQFISGEFELTLEKAFAAKVVDSLDSGFNVTGKVNSAQQNALAMIRRFLSEPYVTRISDIVFKVVREILGYVVVYPVVDESSWEDNKGNILPDALLLPAGTTALDLAFRIHTDIGEGFIRAIDCRTKRAIGKDHALNDSDVIRIVSRTK